MDQHFRENTQHKEHVPQNLAPYIMCIWEMSFVSDHDISIQNTVLPDGCIDLIFDFDKKFCFFVATKKASLKEVVNAHFSFMCIRFKPGTFGQVYNFPSNKLIGKVIPYSEIEEQYFLPDIFNYATMAERCQFIIAYLDYKIPKPLDTTWITFIDDLYDNQLEATLKLFQDKGYATEVMTTLIAYGFNNLNKQKIIAQVKPQNISSIKVIERLGLEYYD